MDGAKMSKSRGTFVLARTYLEFFDPDYYRYYLGARLAPNSTDILLGREDFVTRVNSDLVGKLVNIAARSEGFLAKGCASRHGTRGQMQPIPGKQGTLAADQGHEPSS